MSKSLFLNIALLFSLISIIICAKGEINCQYEISTSGEYVKILGDNFIPDSTITIYINDEEVSFSNKYLFPTPNIYYIKFELEEPTNMDFMFTDVTALNRVEMVSTENLKLTRFESTFEGCTNLLSFTMKGFDTSTATSMKRMFFGTSNLDKTDFSQFNTESVLDMSSMFESSQCLNQVIYLP